jgi:hypothetical protein
MEVKNPIQLASNVYLRQSQLDVEVERIGLDFGTELAFPPVCLFRLENYSAGLTLVSMEPVTSHPPLDSASHEFEIDKGLAVLRMLEEVG